MKKIYQSQWPLVNAAQLSEMTKGISRALFILITSLFILAGSNSRSVAQLAAWTNGNSTSSPNMPGGPSNANVATAVASQSGLGASSSGARWSFTGWSNTAAYVQFAVTAASGYVLNLSGQTMVISSGSSNTGPGSFTFRTSVDNYVGTVGLFAPGCGSSVEHSNTITFPVSTSYNGLTSFTVRMYGGTSACSGAATASGGTGGPDNAVLNGTVTAVVTGCTSVTPGTVSSSAGSSSCSSIATTTLSLVGASTGTGITYLWQSSTDNINWVTATGTSTGATYTTGVISSTTYYRCNVICAAASITTPTPSLPITINSTITPAVVISANPGNTICTGTSTTFTATPTNGGTTPAYQWKKNGGNVGTNSATYTDAALNNSDIITCVMTSNIACSSGPVTSAPITMIVNTPVAPTVTVNASATTVCASTPVTFLASITNGGAAPVYQWKKNGNNVGTNSATYVDATLVNNDIITCVLTSNATCITTTTATSTGTTMTINPLPNVTVNGPFTICAGSTVGLIAAGATSYAWSPTTNLTPTTGATVSASPTTTTTYTVTGTGANTCTNTATVTVNVNTSISAFTVTPTAPSICSGSNVALTANITGTTTIMSEDFNGTAPGWTIDNTGTPAGSIATVQWQQRSSPYAATGGKTMKSADGTAFYVSDADAGGNITINTMLVSPAFSLANVSTATLAYQGFLDKAASGDIYTGFDVSIDGGTTWTAISPQATTDYSSALGGIFTLVNKSVNLSPYAGNANVKVRFRYNTTWGYYWGIDNVSLTGTPLPTWSPITNLFTNAALTTPYTANTPAGTVYAAPTTGAPVYTASVGTCNTTASSTVTANPLPTATISGGTTICAGSPVTISFAGTPNATITYTANTVTRTIILNGSGTATYTPAFTTGATDTTYTLVSVAAATTLCSQTISGQQATVHVNPLLPTTITIAANPGNIICAGTSVTVTATITNGGTTPAYQWKKNGGNVGTNSATYTDNTLANTDIITCVLTSNATCATPVSITSAGITMTVNPLLTPTIAVAANPGNIICAGTPVTFTATTTNPGTIPAYQWKKNGNIVGTNSATYTDNALVNNDIITCVLTSNAVCATPTTAASAAITMIVNPLLTPSVSVAANPGNTICTGGLTTFTATGINPGANPVYQWKKNGNNVGTNNTVYTDNTLNTNDVILCVLTSNATCATTTTATSSNITMTVNPLLTPSLSIATSTPTTICAGTQVLFFATVVNGGTSPVYQWKKNGQIVGISSAFYLDSTLNNNDVVTCTLISNAPCVIINNVVSNSIAMTVNATPSITTNPVSVAVCNGDTAMFTTMAHSTLAFTIQWQMSTDNGTSWGNVNGATDTAYSIITAMSQNNNRYRIISTNSCGITTSTEALLTVNANPTVTLSTSANTSSCIADSVVINAVTVGNVTYQWKFDNNYVSSTSGPVPSYSAHVNGDYTVTVTDNLGCHTTAVPVAVVIKSYPLAQVYNAGGSLVHCQGDSVILSTAANNNAAYAYQWQMNNNNIQNATGVQYTAKDAGNYNVQVTNNGCTSISSTLTVAVKALPSSALTYNGHPVICPSGGSVTLTANDVTGQTYQWLLNSYPIVGAVSPFYTATAVGLYSTAITNATGCSVITTGVHITDAVDPLPGITMQAYTLVAGTFDAYQWYKDGAVISGATHATYKPTQNGNYTVFVTDTNGCTNTSYPYDLTNAGVNNTSSIATAINVYPNPATSIVHIDAPVSINVAVTSIDGRIMLQQNNVKEINVSNLANGVYMILIMDETNALIKTQRVVKAGW